MGEHVTQFVALETTYNPETDTIHTRAIPVVDLPTPNLALIGQHHANLQGLDHAMATEDIRDGRHRLAEDLDEYTSLRLTAPLIKDSTQQSA